MSDYTLSSTSLREHRLLPVRFQSSFFSHLSSPFPSCCRFLWTSLDPRRYQASLKHWWVSTRLRCPSSPGRDSAAGPWGRSFLRRARLVSSTSPTPTARNRQGRNAPCRILKHALFKPGRAAGTPQQNTSAYMKKAKNVPPIQFAVLFMCSCMSNNHKVDSLDLHNAFSGRNVSSLIRASTGRTFPQPYKR